MLGSDSDGGDDMTTVVPADGGCFPGAMPAHERDAARAVRFDDAYLHVAAVRRQRSTCVVHRLLQPQLRAAAPAARWPVSPTISHAPPAAPCCSEQCVNGSCKPLNATCKTAGNAYAGDGDAAASSAIRGDACASPSTISYCTQPATSASTTTTAAPASVRSPRAPPPASARPSPTPCRVDGTTCDGCSGCCSSFCAPFGTGTNKICQPASGCHVLGDLCTKTPTAAAATSRTACPARAWSTACPIRRIPIGTC